MLQSLYLDNSNLQYKIFTYANQFLTRLESKLADSEFFSDFWYQGGVKSTVSGVFEDLKFKISEGQNYSFPVSALLAVSV